MPTVSFRIETVLFIITRIFNDICNFFNKEITVQIKLLYITQEMIINTNYFSTIFFSDSKPLLLQQKLNSNQRYLVGNI